MNKKQQEEAVALLKDAAFHFDSLEIDIEDAFLKLSHDEECIKKTYKLIRKIKSSIEAFLSTLDQEVDTGEKCPECGSAEIAKSGIFEDERQCHVCHHRFSKEPEEKGGKKYTKMRKASYLLPDPGGDVVRELLDDINRLTPTEDTGEETEG